MRYSALLTPITEAEPCGPDLDEVGDDAFLNYTLSVDDRFPVRYYDLDSGAPFDRASIDLRAEVETVSTLLEASRDLRLLGIEARFQILVGQIGGFSECLQAMAGLLERYWDEVHPQAFEGDLTLRQNTVSALASRATVIFPLHNTTIVRDRRHGSITYRHQMILAGEAQPFPAAKPLFAADIAEALANVDNVEAVATCHDHLVAARAAVVAIESIFREKAGFTFVPDLTELADTLGGMAAFIESHVATLAPERPAHEGRAGDGSDAAFGGDGDLAAGAQSLAVAISTQAGAKAALGAAERYFAKHETSSPALILVAQARQLLGKPLVDVLRTLASGEADRAMIRIDAESGFQLDMDRMRDVTDSLEGSAAIVVATPGEPEFSAATRAEAIALMLGVEAFLKRAEPSSPVPLLLEKARGFQDQDFRAILRSLVVR